MPPQVNSRYFRCRGAKDSAGNLFLKERTHINVADILDGSESVHVVVEGESLAKIAYKHFAPLNAPKDVSDPRGAEHLWWILAEVNGIQDGTIDLRPGTTLYIPSQRVVKEKVLNR